MQVYLPIAELSLDVFLLLALGGLVGFISGISGIGASFLMTPILIFIGIPSPVAVASQANQVVATALSGILSKLRSAHLYCSLRNPQINGINRCKIN